MLLGTSQQETTDTETSFLTSQIGENYHVGKDMEKQIYKDMWYTAGGILNCILEGDLSVCIKFSSVYVKIFVNLKIYFASELLYNFIFSWSILSERVRTTIG